MAQSSLFASKVISALQREAVNQAEAGCSETVERAGHVEEQMGTSNDSGTVWQAISKLIAKKRNKLAEIVEAQNEFLKKFGLGAAAVPYAEEDVGLSGCKGKLLKWTMNPSAGSYYFWLGIITVAVMYNAITIIMRSVFNEFQEKYLVVWLALDYICDAVYIADSLIKFRTGYLEQGLIVRDFKKLALNYTNSVPFKLDMLSILPTDVLYFVIGKDNPIIRLNRLLRLPRIFEFTERTETRTNYPNVFRVVVLVVYIVVIIHWNGCIYFALSEYLGLGSDGYVYDNTDPRDSLTRRYLHCFYWSTLSLTTIGETNAPERDIEYVFNIIDYLIGVLIFATIVGNVGSMISNMNASRTDFQNRMDSVKQYMEFRKVSHELQTRVVKWFDYLWSNKHTLTDEAILKTLPDKLQAEIAINVHFNTLRKVRIFQDTEVGLLAEMVLKLKLQVFSPGDYICRKGDIGKEMYIVKQGKLHVVSDDGQIVLATLGDGAVFGELSLLNIVGSKTGNRRTANVRSVGYSDLFSLSKDDLWDTLKEYPEARKMLIQKGREILKKDNLLHEDAPEECETTEEKIEKLEIVAESVKTRFARLIAEYTNNKRKLTERVQYLENMLEKYRRAAKKKEQVAEWCETKLQSQSVDDEKEEIGNGDYGE